MYLPGLILAWWLELRLVSVWEVMGSIPDWDSEFFFVLCL